MIALLSRTSRGRLLMNETEVQCRPLDCPNRGRVEFCRRHGRYHDFEFYRHCDANGNLVHVDVSKCYPLCTQLLTPVNRRLHTPGVKANAAP